MKYILPTIGTLAAVGIFALASTQESAVANDMTSRAQTYEQFDLMSKVLARVRKEYVVDVDSADMIEDAVNGMLQSLDPHSSYMNEEEYKDWQVSMSGQYGGLGMEVTTESGVVKVVAPIEGTPAFRAGIKSGDYLTEIDGESIIGLSLSDAVERMRGKPGEAINITVIRGEEDPLEFDLTREIIQSRPARYEVMDGMGYIRLPQFNEKSEKTFTESITSLKSKLGGSIPGLVIDLRGNPGGSLGECIGVSSTFLDGKEVVSTRGRTEDDIQRYNAESGEALAGVPIIVLIDGASASASEIVAGAIQDHKRGLVVGMTSFGKGSVQTIIPLSGGRDGAMRLTTQRYYTPDGRSIQGSGITPDILVAARPDDGNGNNAFKESDLPNAIQNELESMDDDAAEEQNIDFPPADYPEESDYQLEAALKILRDGQYNTLLAELSQ